jgi:hypothetical protein
MIPRERGKGFPDREAPYRDLTIGSDLQRLGRAFTLRVV